MRRFETIISIIKPAVINYHNHGEYKATFNFTDDTWYFTNGSLAAQKFGIKVPTVVYLDYQFLGNRFNMTEVKPTTMYNPIAESKIITLSSNSDDGESTDEEFGGNYNDGSDDEGTGDQSGGESDDGISMDGDGEDDDLYEFDVTVSETMTNSKQVLVSFID
jgi:hypothetical protein